MGPTLQGGEGWLADFSGYSQEALEREIARLKRVADRSAATLVVDDMQTMRLLLAQSLKQAGFSSVERTADGDTALRMMRERGCDLALVDWNMPRMDGLDLLDQVRADPELEDIIFIMVTAETLDLRVMRAAEEKQDAYLTKPISADKLTRRLELILEKRLTTARALLLEARGEADRGVEEYMAAAHNRPHARWPLFGLGGLLARQGRMEEAERCYQRILDTDPQATAALVELGRIRESLGRVDEGRALYRQAMDQSPRFFRAYDALAESMLAQGDAQGAAEVITGALCEQGTENARRQELMGKVCLETGRPGQAEAAFRRAMELKPRHRTVHKRLGLGHALLDQERWAEAAEALEQAAQLGRGEGLAKEQLDALLLAGKAWASAQENGKAEEVLAKIMEPETWTGGEPPWDQQRFHREAGAVFLGAGRETPAVRHFTTAIMLDPEDQANLDAIEHICSGLGLAEVADLAADTARTEASQAAEDSARRGLELVAQGRLREALAEYHRGLAMDPASGRLHFNLGRLLDRLEDRRNALAEMAAAARHGLARQDWELLVEVARFLGGKGHHQQAMGILKRVMASRPGYPGVDRLWNALSQAAAKGGDQGAGQV